MCCSLSAVCFLYIQRTLRVTTIILLLLFIKSKSLTLFDGRKLYLIAAVAVAVDGADVYVTAVTVVISVALVAAAAAVFAVVPALVVVSVVVVIAVSTDFDLSLVMYFSPFVSILYSESDANLATRARCVCVHVTWRGVYVCTSGDRTSEHP